VEKYASNKARKDQDFSKKDWAHRLQGILEIYESIFHPELFILGGQLSRKTEKTFPYIKINTAFKAAEFLNDASIVGAAMVAAAEGEKEQVFFR
jgi:polyphosphate glucokinase